MQGVQISVTTPPITSMLAVTFYSDDGKIVDGTNGWGSFHATRHGQCLIFRPEVIWPWMAALVGMTFNEGFRPSLSGLIADFDVALSRPGGVTYGLQVWGGKPWLSDQPDERRHASLSLDAFWNELVKLFEAQGG